MCAEYGLFFCHCQPLDGMPRSAKICGMYPLLACYPFADTRVQLVEGFAAYDGVLKDEPGTPHKGIDYVVRRGEAFLPFNVYAMHDGVALQGVSATWGNFVAIYASPLGDGRQLKTIYAHLDGINPDMPSFAKDGSALDGMRIPMGTMLGRAGVSGSTNGIPQLHLELHEKDLQQVTTKRDPYGVYDRASSGRYPQPGKPLHGLDHAWVSDTPSYASGQ